MFSPLARASLLALTLLGVSVASWAAQPDSKPENKSAEPPYTAFPDLKPSPNRPDTPHLIPVLPTLPADASPLRKVRHAQAAAGLSYIARIGEGTRLGTWDSRFLFDTVLITNEVYIVAAEYEESLANQIPWYEERVRTLKQLERLLEARWQLSGNFASPPPVNLNLVRFHRLQAELDLLTLKDTVAKRGGGTPQPLVMKKVEIVPFSLKVGEPFDPEKFAGYTAFPDLKAWTEEKKTVTTPDGKTRVVSEKVGIVPLPRLPILPASASALRKVRHEQVLEGFGYLQTATPTPRPLRDMALTDFLHYARNTADTYRTAVELEERPADRVPWYEARVRLLKLAERIVTLRVLNEVDPPHKLDAIRFLRFQTEADLLRLKTEIAKSGPATGPPPAREASAIEERWGLDDVKPRPYYTAFPELKPRTVEKFKVGDFEGMADYRFREKDVVPLPALPVVGPDTPTARKLRVEQVRQGLTYLDRVREAILHESWTAQYFTNYLHMTAETFRAAAELEDTLLKRIPWYEARVRAFKDIEVFVEGRLQNGTDSLDRLYATRIERLRAEAELLILKEEAAKPAPAAVVVCPPCPPVCERPRGGLLPRLFHRR